MQGNISRLHNDTNAAQNGKQIKRMLVLFGICILIAALLIAASFIWRDASHIHNPNEGKSQIITIAITVAFGALIIFLWGMKMTPRLCYRRYLREIHAGLSRTVEGVVTQLDADLAFREGLYFYACIINVGDINEPEDDRRLYYDAQLGAPPFAISDKVRICAHGNDIIGFDPVG